MTLSVALSTPKSKLHLAIPAQDPKKAAKAVWIRIQEVFCRTVDNTNKKERASGIKEAKAIYAEALREGKFEGASFYQEACKIEIECLVTPKSIKTEKLEMPSKEPLVVRGAFPWSAELQRGF